MYLHDLRRRDADVLGGGDRAVFNSRRHEGAAGEVPGATKHAAGALVDGGDGVSGEERLGGAGDRDVVGEVVGHVLALEGLHVAPADDAGREGLGGVKEELVDEGDLAREDYGDESSGIEVGLRDSVELIENVEAEEMGLVDEEDGDLFFAGYVEEKGAHKGDHLGDGVGHGRVAEGDADLTEEFHEGA